MDRNSTRRLLDSITTDLTESKAKQIRLHLETFIESYHAAQKRISDLTDQLTHANFDRECLAAEKLELEELVQNLTEEPEDELLIAGLIEQGIPRDEKIAAVKFVKSRTGWSLKDSKKWVEEHYYQT